MDRFFAAERFRRTPAAFRPHLEEAEWLPNVKLADVRPPRKTTPVRRLTSLNPTDFRRAAALRLKNTEACLA